MQRKESLKVKYNNGNSDSVHTVIFLSSVLYQRGSGLRQDLEIKESSNTKDPAAELIHSWKNQTESKPVCYHAPIIFCLSGFESRWQQRGQQGVLDPEDFQRETSWTNPDAQTTWFDSFHWGGALPGWPSSSLSWGNSFQKLVSASQISIRYPTRMTRAEGWNTDRLFTLRASRVTRLRLIITQIAPFSLFRTSLPTCTCHLWPKQRPHPSLPKTQGSTASMALHRTSQRSPVLKGQSCFGGLRGTNTTLDRWF